jgi:hypothetical protein
MTHLRPKGMSHRTKAAQTCNAWADDLEHVVDGLREAAGEYKDVEDVRYTFKRLTAIVRAGRQLVAQAESSIRADDNNYRED